MMNISRIICSTLIGLFILNGMQAAADDLDDPCYNASKVKGKYMDELEGRRDYHEFLRSLGAEDDIVEIVKDKTNWGSIRKYLDSNSEQVAYIKRIKASQLNKGCIGYEKDVDQAVELLMEAVDMGGPLSALSTMTSQKKWENKKYIKMMSNRFLKSNSRIGKSTGYTLKALGLNPEKKQNSKISSKKLREICSLLIKARDQFPSNPIALWGLSSCYSDYRWGQDINLVHSYGLAANLVTNTEPSAGLIQLSSKLTDFQIQKNKLLAYTLADIAVPQMSTNDQHKSDKKPAQVKYFSGTAFFIDKEHLVTNEHVVAGASNISIGFKGVRKTASLVSSNASDDIAILKLNTPFSYTSCFSLSNNAAIVPGTTVYAAGFPRSDVLSSDGKITDGIISSKNGMLDNPKTFQISTPVQSGNSGGPIFVQDGRLAGVVVAKLKDGENVNFGIKSAVAKMHVDLSGINPTCTNPLNRMTDFHSAIAIVNSEVYP